MANDLMIISLDEFMICLYIIQCYHFLEDWSYVSRFFFKIILIDSLKYDKIWKNNQG